MTDIFPQLKDISDFCIVFMIGAAVFLLLFCSVLRILQCRRGRDPDDGLLVLCSWPAAVRGIVPFLVVLFIVTPLLLCLLAYLGAAVLAPAEGWKFIVAFKHLICNILQIGPLEHLKPTSLEGKIVAILINMGLVILSTIVLGLTAGMVFILRVGDLLPVGQVGMFTSIVCSYVSFAMLIVACALILGAIEGYPLEESILYMSALLCNINTPNLTAWAPRRVSGHFFVGFANCLALSVEGAVLGVVVSHPKMNQFLHFLEGVQGRKVRVKRQRCVDEQYDGTDPEPGELSDSFAYCAPVADEDRQGATAQQRSAYVKPTTENVDSDTSTNVLVTVRESNSADAVVRELRDKLLQSEEANSRDRAEIEWLHTRLELAVADNEWKAGLLEDARKQLAHAEAQLRDLQGAREARLSHAEAQLQDLQAGESSDRLNQVPYGDHATKPLGLPMPSNALERLHQLQHEFDEGNCQSEGAEQRAIVAEEPLQEDVYWQRAIIAEHKVELLQEDVSKHKQAMEELQRLCWQLEHEYSHFQCQKDQDGYDSLMTSVPSSAHCPPSVLTILSCF